MRVVRFRTGANSALVLRSASCEMALHAVRESGRCCVLVEENPVTMSGLVLSWVSITRGGRRSRGPFGAPPPPLPPGGGQSAQMKAQLLPN